MYEHTVHFKSGKVLNFHSEDSSGLFAAKILKREGKELAFRKSDARGIKIAIFPDSIEYIETEEH